MTEEKNGKARYFMFLVYPESAPKDWQKSLERSMGMYAISPLHEPDASDTEQAKPHYHVIYKHSNSVTLDAAKRAIPDAVPANGYIEPVFHPGNAQRYLIHLDQPEKQQFEGGISTITVINGFPLDLSRELSKVEKCEIRKSIFEWIRDNGINEYSTLLDSLDMLGNPDMFEYAFNHTIAFNAYLKSRRHSGM